MAVVRDFLSVAVLSCKLTGSCWRSGDWISSVEIISVAPSRKRALNLLPRRCSSPGGLQSVPGRNRGLRGTTPRLFSGDRLLCVFFGDRRRQAFILQVSRAVQLTQSLRRTIRPLLTKILFSSLGGPFTSPSTMIASSGPIRGFRVQSRYESRTMNLEGRLRQLQGDHIKIDVHSLLIIKLTQILT